MSYIELTWNDVPRFLKAGDCWDFVEEGNRRVEIANMVGGRYLLLEDGDVAGQTDDESEAVEFLKGATIAD